MHAAGPFHVTLTPQTTTTPALGRRAIDKRFSGDLEATSQGEMLTVGTPVKGSAAYVALEQVSGTLHGRRGSFALQHLGVMHRGAGQLTVSVVPDSGTEELLGLSGQMTIHVKDGEHSYAFEYTLPTP